MTTRADACMRGIERRLAAGLYLGLSKNDGWNHRPLWSRSMASGVPCVLTINGGSSSIRFAVYEAAETPRRRLDGKIDRLGSNGTTLIVTDPAGTRQVPRRLDAANHHAAVAFQLNWLEAQPVLASVNAVGHRVVHGMTHSEPERITPRLVAALRRITPYDPDHLPREIRLIEAFSRRHPQLPQVACFDTAFHRTMPRVARLLPIPRRYGAKGVERYGFHGLSYAYLTEELGRLDTLVFAAGNGEHVPPVRERICDGLDFLGIELDPARNARNAALISSDAGRVTVRVIHTDEDLMIATLVTRLLQLGSPRKA